MHKAFTVCCIGETGAERRGGINESVTSEVSAVFRGKTVSYFMFKDRGSLMAASVVSVCM